MSIKDDVNYIKNELSNEEKFLESFVKTERFFKKYKNIIFVLVLVLIIGTIGYFIKNGVDKSNLYDANVALNKYLETNDKQALEILKDKNKNLYEIALYLDAKKEQKNSDISLKYLKDILDYQVAVINSNSNELDVLSKKSDFLLKDYAIFNRALILVNDQKYVEAKELLEQISKDSRASELANLLKHYLVTK
ncbi:hypothetical protein [Aliarcobacter vitoriensis]|uniref:Tetratricopeptide repeat-like domain-containing protein n=1 Tax=Aliarcobacter vitoriensis TaxID=2011099 RepID=A0A366MRH3_9BACT|nr:hypothetical protein [Aliarcobacter vitoriensis]RBQ28194.1 hypothetical protein CRU91_10600 [Aliarcobacter vitoriensis]